MATVETRAGPKWSTKTILLGCRPQTRRSSTKKLGRRWKLQRRHGNKYHHSYKSLEGSVFQLAIGIGANRCCSFLDESRNTELIRWSQNGDSFIVLDEEEFARTLIPELFKHANYASFVRQLNMYGFHKQVGLSDNSMRASERKNKSPSEYKNPYFRRGKANWMWLIQKPKSAQGKGKAGKDKHEEGNDEDESFDAENPGLGGVNGKDRAASIRAAKPPLMIDQGDDSIAQDELAALHQELRMIRQQHQAIAGVIQKIRRDHDQIFQQAQAFQDLHNRHENSINAILTFLATVYNRSLEGRGGQNIGNMFAGSIPHDIPQQGSVVDVGDIGEQTLNPGNAPSRRQPRRQPLLLQAPPSRDGVASVNAGSTASTPQAGTTPSNYDPVAFTPERTPASNHPIVEELPDQDPGQDIRSTPQLMANSNNNGGPNFALPERDIMSLINSANANDTNAPGTSHMDFGEALSHLQNRDGKGPLTPTERNGMLQMMANGSGQGIANGNNGNNALTTPNPPTAPAPSFDNWQASDDDIAFLQKSMQDTDSKLTNISNRLSPISPNGGIPGFNEAGSYVPPPANDSLDFDQIFNSGDYFNDVNNSAGFGDDAAGFGGNEDFSFDDPLGSSADVDYGAGPSNDPGGRVVETVNSSEATSPATTTEDGTQEEANSPRKKRRRN